MSDKTFNRQRPPAMDKMSTVHPPVNVKKTLANFQNDLQLLINDRTQALENVYRQLRTESCKRRMASEAMVQNEKKISSLMSVFFKSDNIFCRKSI